MTRRRSTYREVLLLEDDSDTAERRRHVGNSDGEGARITVRVHRFNGAGSTVAASRTYRAGSMRGKRNGRIRLAVRLLERTRSGGRSVVVAGPSYGAASAFVATLCAREVPFVVQVRPATLVEVMGANREARTVADLVTGGRWRRVSASLPDGTIVEYTAAKLADVRLPTGRGKLFAARIGSVAGAQRTSIIGLSSFDASLEELVRLTGYTRWIRRTARRQARAARGPSRGAEPAGKAATLAPRANIALARKHDDRAWQDAWVTDFAPEGILRAASPMLNIAELFAGAGGMGLGFLQAGAKKRRCRLVYSGEVNPIYAQTLRTNHATLTSILGQPPGTVTPKKTEATDLRRREILEELVGIGSKIGGINVLIGGPPCQGFSMANRNSWHGRNPNNELVEVFLRYVKALRPQVFLLENVQGILWTPKGKSSVSVVDVLERRLQSLGYLVFPKLLDAVWYGVPQHRTRFFVMGIHRDVGYSAESFGDWGPFPHPSYGTNQRDYVTVAEAIGDLPPVGNGDRHHQMKYSTPAAGRRQPNEFLSHVRNGAARNVIFDHITSRHADYVIERYRKIPQGGNWQSIKKELANYADMSRTHSNIYRRLRWDEPSITIGHYRKSMLVHPEQHRGLSVREAARLQSFPDWFRFLGTEDGSAGGLTHKQQQLANAVCPLVSQAIAEFILDL